MNITVLKRNGTKEPYNANLINKALERACEKLSDPVSKVVQIATETELTLFYGITTEQLDQALINTAVQNIKDDPEFDIIASRLYLKLPIKKYWETLQLIKNFCGDCKLYISFTSC